MQNKTVKVNKNAMKYRVFVLLNHARMPQNYKSRKTLQAARTFLQGVSRHKLFAGGHIERFDAQSGQWVFVEGHEW